MRKCEFEGCDRKHKAKGYCGDHYRQLRLGLELTPLVDRPSRGGQYDFLSVLAARDNLPESCIEWPYALHENGYGEVHYKGDRWRAHRLVLAFRTGEMETDLYALHSCHNRACVNPRHLRWGTHKENMRDMVEAGRQKSITKPFIECVHAGCDRRAAVDGKQSGYCGAHYYQIKTFGETYDLGSLQAHPNRDKLMSLIADAGEACIPWLGGKSDRIGVNGINWTPTRLALTLSRPDEEPKKYAAHTCDDVSCVNPNHLQWSEKILLPSARGEAVGNSTLTEDRVRYIRASPASANALAEELGIAASLVYSVRAGRTWAWLDDYEPPKRVKASDFLDEAVASDTEACILWPYSMKRGVGHLDYEGTHVRAPRKCLELAGKGLGRVDGHQAKIGYTCGEKSCVNPKHLFWKSTAKKSPP